MINNSLCVSNVKIIFKKTRVNYFVIKTGNIFSIEYNYIKCMYNFYITRDIKLCKTILKLYKNILKLLRNSVIIEKHLLKLIY